MVSRRSPDRPTGQPRCQLRPTIERHTELEIFLIAGLAPEPVARDWAGVEAGRGAAEGYATGSIGGTLLMRWIADTSADHQLPALPTARQAESTRGLTATLAWPAELVRRRR